MSGIAGLFNRDDQPVAPEILQRMTAVARHRGPDGIHSWIRHPAGLAQLLMATTPEAVRETHPLCDAGSGACIVFDGRIDNRDELRRALAGHPAGPAGGTDMELVLRAYVAWGPDCAARLIGDFAFAIWDPRCRRMFCARDIAAVKPFCYFACAQAFVFGSEIAQVLQHPLVSREPDEGMVGEMLACAYVSRDATIYRDVRRLPAAHCLLVDAKGLQVRRYWDTDPERRLTYPNERDYVEHYREIFRDAVSCRLRARGNVGTTLSGGLDSPSVAGMAQTVFDAGGGGRVLESFSLVYPGRECDESALIGESVDKWGFVAHHHAFTRFESAPAWAEQVRASLTLPDYPTLTALGFLHEIARARGIRVLLSGAGAASWFWGTEYPYLGLLLHREFGRLFGEFRHHAQTRGWAHAGSRLARSLLWPAVPASLRRKLEASRNRMLPTDFLREDFVRAIDLHQRVRKHDCADRFCDLAQWDAWHQGTAGSTAFYRECEDASDARNGIEERHPFWDRRLVEFSQAIPDFRHHDRDRHKLLIREAGEQLLPAAVRANPAATEVGCVFVEAMKHASVREAFGSMDIADRGWVVPGRVKEVYDRLCGGYRNGGGIPLADYRLLMPLWMVFAVECWQRGARDDPASRRAALAGTTIDMGAMDPGGMRP